MSVQELEGLDLCDDCRCFNFGAEDICELNKWPEGVDNHWKIPKDFTCPYPEILMILRNTKDIKDIKVTQDTSFGAPTGIEKVEFWVRRA